jgi:hypothetical protein
MNSYEIQNAARGFVQQMKDDVRNKLNQFLRETGVSISQMARDLGISETELRRVQEGEDFSVITFATLLIADGKVLEVKDLRDAPIPTRHGVPVPPRDGGFRAPHDEQLPPPPPGFFDAMRRGEAPAPGAQPRDARGRFMPRTDAPRPAARPAAAPQGPDFASMERPKLVEIIQNKLWDTEIDVTRATRDQLVRFLEDKNRRLADLQARKEAANDPAVADLKDKIKKTLEDNPHLRSVLKQLID